jgi:inhibitor of KinA sporulation pathway (predicted exonuclease)
MEDYTYICALDFEATCEKEILINNQEIIEFPSILYKVKNLNKENTEYEIIGEFREFIKPIFNPILTDFCKELTAITQQQVDEGLDFNTVLNMHIEWLSICNVDFGKLVFITCGAWDLKTALPNNLKLFNLQKYEKYYKKIINIKKDFLILYGQKMTSLVDSLEYLGEKFEGRLHSGYADTKAVARIFEIMIRDNYKNFNIIEL